MVRPRFAVISLLILCTVWAAPRLHRWKDHFELLRGRVVGLTPIGRTTVALFQMNTPDRVELRVELQAAGLWD